MKNLKIGMRLYLVFILFMIPSAYLVYSLIATQNVAIDATHLELRGNRYLTAIRDVHYQMVGVVPKSSAIAGLVRELDGLVAAGCHHDFHVHCLRGGRLRADP